MSGIYTIAELGLGGDDENFNDGLDLLRKTKFQQLSLYPRMNGDDDDEASFPENWSPTVEENFMNFIATCPNIKELKITHTTEKFGIHKIFQNCVAAAMKNPHILRVTVTVLLETSRITAIHDMLLIGKEKVKKIVLTQVDAQGRLRYIFNGKKLKLLIAAVASLENLETLEAYSLSDNVFLKLMTTLTQRKSPSTLKDVHLESERSAKFITIGLPGIDMFLASNAASSLKQLSIKFHGLPKTEAVRKVAHGLSQNNCLEKLEFSADLLTTEDALALADGLRGMPKSVKEVAIHNGARISECQNIILRALYSNTSIRKLSLLDGFFDEDCSESVSELLIRNSYLETLECCGEGFIPLTNAWIQSTAKGLACNSTLKSMKIIQQSMIIHDEATVRVRGVNVPADIRPLFDALKPDINSGVQCGLQKLLLSGYKLAKGCAQTISSTISNPDCLLQELQLEYNFRDDEFLQILSGAQSATSLQTLVINAGHYLVQEEMEDVEVEEVELGYQGDTLAAIPSIVAKLPLHNLYVAISGEQLEHSIVRSIKEDILHNVLLNKSLEKVQFDFGRQFSLDESPDFKSKLNEYCNRNVSIKASNALNTDSSVSKHLPIASIPNVLETLHKRCCWASSASGVVESNGDDSTSQEKQYMELSSTILFSVLRGRCDLSKPWDAIMSPSSLSSAAAAVSGKKRKRVQQNQD